MLVCGSVIYYWRAKGGAIWGIFVNFKRGLRSNKSEFSLLQNSWEIASRKIILYVYFLTNFGINIKWVQSINVCSCYIVHRPDHAYLTSWRPFSTPFRKLTNPESITPKNIHQDTFSVSIKFDFKFIYTGGTGAGIDGRHPNSPNTRSRYIYFIHLTR